MGVIWLTAVFRTRALFINDFHADEALFSSWARYIAVWRDPLLLTQAVDKPPLLFYLQALFYPLQGPVEWAARLPNYIASILLVPLVVVVVWRLFRRWETAVFAAALVAFSPLHIQFSSSAFTDPLLTTFLFVSIGLQLLGANPPGGLIYGEPHLLNLPEGGGDRKRPYISGLFFGLAVLTKHQAWLFLPLLLGLGWVLKWRRDWFVWLRGFLPLLFLGWGWEFWRNGRLTLISAQVENVGGFQLIERTELLPRLFEWLILFQYVISPLILIGGVAWLLLVIVGKWRKGQLNSRKQLGFLLIGSYILAYALFHLIVDIPVWDRYLLPLVPLLTLLIAFSFHQFIKGRKIENGGWLALTVLVTSLMVPQAWQAGNGRLPIGARPFADSGAAHVAGALSDEPYGTVLYDHWYSWHWRYHLFDKQVHLNWFPDEAALVEDLNIFFDNEFPRYLAIPKDERGSLVEQQVKAAGFSLEPVAIDGESDIILYRINFSFP